MSSYLDIICKDIREEINKYLIPSPPPYNEESRIDRIHVVNTTTGKLVLSSFSKLSSRQFFNFYSSKCVYKQGTAFPYIHTCNHSVVSDSLIVDMPMNHPCFWCKEN